MAPRVGLEPTTLRLTVACSTIELPGNIPEKPQDGLSFSEKPSKALGFLKEG
jgi:hypothetical protein